MRIRRLAAVAVLSLLSAAPSLARTAPQLAVERGLLALAEDRLEDARALALEAIAADPEDPAAFELYARALRGGGLNLDEEYLERVRARDELAWVHRRGSLPGAGPALAKAVGGLVLDGESPEPGLIADPDLEAALRASAAMAAGDVAGARSLVAERDSAEASAVLIDAAMAAGAPREAAVAARRALDRWPDRPDVVLGLWRGGEARGLVRKSRRQSLDLVVARGLASADPAVVYAARRVALRAGARAEGERLAAHLVALGEPSPALDRGGWSPQMQAEIGRALAMRGRLELPPATDDELLGVVTNLAAAYAYRGREAEVPAAWEAANARSDSFGTALGYGRALLAAGAPERAVPVLEQAVRTAALPAPDDLEASDRGSRAEDAAAAWGALASALAPTADPWAWRDATVAAVLAPRPGNRALRDELADLAPVAAVPEPGDDQAAEWAVLDLLRLGGRALAGGAAEEAMSYAVEALDAACPPGADVEACAPRVADALELRARALEQLGSPADALATLDAAVLLVDRPAWQRRRGDMYAAVGARDAAFAAYALAARGGEPVGEALAETYGGLASAQVAAGAAARRWSASALSTDAWDVEPLVVGAFGGALGEPMPPFAVRTDGPVLESTELAGQVVVVAFWASWCKPCLEELPGLARVAATARAQGVGVTVLAVSVDDRERDFGKYAARLDSDELVFTWSPELGRAFGVRSIPALWVFGPDGRATYRRVGYDDGAESAVARAIAEAGGA